MVREVLKIVNKLGLHMRAANVLAEAASGFEAKVWVSRGEIRVDGKSIMGLMMLAAPIGAEIEIEADGPDEAEALGALKEFIEGGFGEGVAQ